MSIQNRINTFRENFFSLRAFFIFIALFAVYSVFVYSVVTKEMHVSNPDLLALLATAFVGAISFIFIIAFSDKYSLKKFDSADFVFFTVAVIVFFVGVVGVVGVVSVRTSVASVEFFFGMVYGFCALFGVFSAGVVFGIVGSFSSFAMAIATAYGIGLISPVIAMMMAQYSIGGFLIFIGLVMFSKLLNQLADYLNNTQAKTKKETNHTIKENRELQEKIETLQADMNALQNKQAGITQEDSKKLADTMQQRLEKQAITDYVESVKAEFLKEKHSLDVQQKNDTTLTRLEVARTTLIQRGTFNLLMGVVLALTGLGLLGVFIFHSPIQPTENYTLLQFASETLPRVSAVFILELLAYFFIHLYRLSLVEDKYYHNETTNLENQYLALEIALNHDNQGMIDACLQQLLATERNPVLDKGQATREILHERNQLSQEQTIPDSVIRLFEAINKNDGDKTAKGDSEGKK